MPAMDKSNRKTPVVDFRVGKLDSNVENPPGILPPADLKPEGFAAYFKPRFNRGMYDAVALMGSHTVLDNQGCVEAKNTGEHGWGNGCRVLVARVQGFKDFSVSRIIRGKGFKGIRVHQTVE